MDGFAFYALIGLLLLIPLEVFFLIIAAAFTRRRELEPKLTLPSQKRQEERYGWEDMLKLSPESKPSRSHNYFLAAIIIVLLVVVVAVPGWFLVAPSLKLNLSKQSINDTTLMPLVEVNETEGKGIFSNLTLPNLNFTASKVNLSGVFAPLKANIKVVTLSLVVLFVAVAALYFIIHRRKLAVIKKARETAEKLIRKKAEKEKKASPSAQRGFFSRLKGVRNYVAPLVILFLLVVIAFLVYILRDRIRTEFSDKLLSFAVSLKEFALNYRLYVLAGCVALLVLVLLLRYIAKRRQK